MKTGQGRRDQDAADELDNYGSINREFCNSTQAVRSLGWESEVWGELRNRSSPCWWIHSAFLQSLPSEDHAALEDFIPRGWLPLVAAVTHHWMICDRTASKSRGESLAARWNHLGAFKAHAPGQWNKIIWGDLDLRCPPQRHKPHAHLSK